MMMIDIKKHTTTELHGFNNHNGYSFVRINGWYGTVASDQLRDLFLNEGGTRLITFYRSVPHKGAVVWLVPLSKIKFATPILDSELENAATLGFKFFTGRE